MDFMITEIIPEFSNDIPCHIVEDSVLDDPESLFTTIFPGFDFDTYAFIATSGERKDIFIRASIFNDPSLCEAVLAHEYAHSIGIDDEEEADAFAVDMTSDDSGILLKSNWEVRHGRTYEEFKEV